MSRGLSNLAIPNRPNYKISDELWLNGLGIRSSIRNIFLLIDENDNAIEDDDFPNEFWMTNEQESI